MYAKIKRKYIQGNIIWIFQAFIAKKKVISLYIFVKKKNMCPIINIITVHKNYISYLYGEHNFGLQDTAMI